VKLRLLARQLTVSAPRMTVRRHVPWPLRLAPVTLAVVAGALGAFALWQALFGRAEEERGALQAQVEQMRRQLGEESAQRQRLAGVADAADSQLKVERTAAERLAAQVRTLESENARLKADLAYLESLLPAGAAEGIVAIRRFEVEPDPASGQLRYRALLTQGGRPERDFEGSMQLLVSAVDNGKPVTLAVAPPGGAGGGVAAVVSASGGAGPAAGAAAGERTRLQFRRYLRMEGQLSMPAGLVARSVQLRVFEGGALRAQQTAAL
jgi:hypothetical protein